VIESTAVDSIGAVVPVFPEPLKTASSEAKNDHPCVPIGRPLVFTIDKAATNQNSFQQKKDSERLDRFVCEIIFV
jgi:hypothetical protein